VPSYSLPRDPVLLPLPRFPNHASVLAQRHSIP